MAVFDVILLIIVILCVIVGMRRGFVLTLCGVLSIVVALVGAKVAADQFSPAVTQAIVPRVETAMEARLQESVGDTVQNSTDWDENVFDTDLGGILGILQQSEAYQNAVSEIQDSIQSGVDSAVKTAAGAMAQEIAQPVAWGTVYVIAFVVILLLWNLISKALDLVVKAARAPLFQSAAGRSLRPDQRNPNCRVYLLFDLKFGVIAWDNDPGKYFSPPFSEFAIVSVSFQV